ncbi:MAG TPA: tyrosine-type recombinase/integrase [Candidatus Sulfotelmatobacter sp.]|nr:tyrosine-type recombinase/integrase [Candidatus Sulfotelmatobacter sp.]
MSKISWNREQQESLLNELKGFWQEDVWDMRNSPAQLRITAKQRFLRFKCKSASLNGELKYACWKKFSGGGWRTVQEVTKVHLVIKWLNTINELPSSLLDQTYDQWRSQYTRHLKKRDMYHPGTVSRMDREQRLMITPRDSPYIGILRQIYFTLETAYDNRPEYKKDVWNLHRLSVPTNLSLSNLTLSFRGILQPWLRRAVKEYIRYSLTIYAEGTCRTRLQSLTCFSRFLAQARPKASASSLTRKLMLEYMSYLPKRVCTAVRKTHLLNLRTFVEIASREQWLRIPSERIIFDEEIPQPPKPQPRYIPAAVLDQLNSHLGDLKSPWMQMVLILQECGMRISELLQLSLDCMTQDARGTFYLRFLQGKMKREHTIPVSQEIARVVHEQQQAVRSFSRSALLFPSPKGGVIKQYSFAHRINRLAYDHQIRDAGGKLFRFQSHQFRHTVGTRMINLGIPHHFIQRYLGHLGPEMTSRYAHIHDVTMREKLSEYLQGTLVDISGKAVPQEGPVETGDLRWFTRNVLAQALTNGYCAIPVIAGPCPHPNACLNCAHFRTDASFLDVHRSELRETERVIEKAKTNGWTRQIEMNDHKRNNLVNIITSLEQANA